MPRIKDVLLLVPLMVGCQSKTADDVDPCIETTGGAVGSAAKTGGETAVAGVTTLGESIGGLFDGGTDEAKKKWDSGAAKTKTTAKGGGADTKGAAKAVDCK